MEVGCRFSDITFGMAEVLLRLCCGRRSTKLLAAAVRRFYQAGHGEKTCIFPKARSLATSIDGCVLSMSWSTSRMCGFHLPELQEARVFALQKKHNL